MQLAKNTKVAFVELPGTDLHKYLLTKRKGSTPVEISGVTTMLRKLGLTKGYGHINPDVLARAASRGTAIHELFQGYEMQGLAMNRIHFEWDCEDGTHKGEDEDVTKMMRKYAELSSQNFRPLAVEYLVSDNESVASMVDFVSEVDAKTVDLIDYKSSSTLDKEGLAWQLSVYKYLVERQNKGITARNLLGVHCHDEKVKIVPVAYKGDEAVAEAIERFRKGDCASMASDVPAVINIEALLPEYPAIGEALGLKRDLQAKIKEIDAAIADALDSLKEKMRERGLTEVSVPGGRYVYTAEHTQQTFDSKALKAMYPDLGERFTKETAVAASLKFYASK